MQALTTVRERVRGLRAAVEDHPRAATLAVLVFALILPWLPLGDATNYVTRVATLTMVYMALALGLNIVPGFTGLLDLGYVGFYGIGAYTAGLLTVHFGWSYWVILPLAALNGALWGILLGAPTLRLTGDYFAIVTFGFSELVVLVIRNELWLTRGPMGIPGIAAPSVFGHVLSKDWEFFYLMLALLVFVVILVRRIEDSRLGRAWFAIREDEIAAEACGVNIIRYKIIAFAISAAIGALAGSFYARWFRFIHPDMFKFWESILVLCLIVLGGMGSVVGVMVGALVMIPMTEILRVGLGKFVEWAGAAGITWISPDIVNARYLIFGLLLVLMMRFRPEGLLPAFRVRGEMHPSSDRMREEEDESFYEAITDGGKNSLG